MPRPRTSLALCVLAVLMLAQIGLAQKQKVILDTDIGSDIDESQPPNAVIGVSIDEDAFMDRLIRRLKRGPIAGS